MRVGTSFWCRWNVIQLLRDSVAPDRLGFLFVPIGKPANTVVKRILWDFEMEAGFPKATLEGYFDVHNVDWCLTHSGASPWALYHGNEMLRFVGNADRYFLFTVVRNPFVRLLSVYLDKFGRGRPQRFRKGPRACEIKMFQPPRVPRDFAEFVAMVCEQDDTETNTHSIGQAYATGYDFLKYDFIGNLERFDYSLRTMATRVGAAVRERPNKAPHKTSAQQKIAAHYTPDLVRRVVTRYERDFCCFGYTDTLVDLNWHLPNAHSESGRHSGLTPALAHARQAAMEDVPRSQLRELISADISGSRLGEGAGIDQGTVDVVRGIIF